MTGKIRYRIPPMWIVSPRAHTYRLAVGDLIRHRGQWITPAAHALPQQPPARTRPGTRRAHGVRWSRWRQPHDLALPHLRSDGYLFGRF